MLPEDMIADDSEMAKQEPPTEIELQDEQIEQVLDSINLDKGDFAAMYGSMAETAKKAGKALVTVTRSVSNVDWFNDPYEREDQTSGIIIAKLEKEALILVQYEKVIDAENIMITFCNGEQAEAQLKKKDVNTKLAVLSVPFGDMEKESINAIEAADLSASSSNRGFSERR